MSLTVIVFMESETLRRLSMELSNAAMAPGSGAMQLNDTLSGRGDTRNGAGDDGSAPWRKRKLASALVHPEDGIGTRPVLGLLALSDSQVLQVSEDSRSGVAKEA